MAFYNNVPLKNKNGDTYYPQSKTNSVYDDETGERLDKILEKFFIIEDEGETTGAIELDADTLGGEDKEYFEGLVQDVDDKFKNYYSLKGGIEILEGEDLNDPKFLEVGSYYCESNTTANTLLNLPPNMSKQAFIMHVHLGTGGGYPVQKIETFERGEIWRRVYDLFSHAYSLWVGYITTNQNPITGEDLGISYEGHLDDFKELNKFIGFDWSKVQGYPSGQVGYARIINLGFQDNVFSQYILGNDGVVFVRPYTSWNNPKWGAWQRLLTSGQIINTDTMGSADTVPSSAVTYQLGQELDTVKAKLSTDLSYIISTIPRINTIANTTSTILGDISYMISTKGIESGSYAFAEANYTDRPTDTYNWGYIEYFKHASNYVTVKFYGEDTNATIYIRRFILGESSWYMDWKQVAYI